MAGKDYANQCILTPFRANQMQGTQLEKKMKAAYNTEHASHQVFIEHVIRHVKTYQAIGQIFRQQLHLMLLTGAIGP